MAPDSNNAGGDGRKNSPVKTPSFKVPMTNEEDLSDEDLGLKKKLELYVKRIRGSNSGLHEAALESLREEIRTSPSSLTSIPKPVKFLHPHYGTLKACYETMADSDLKKLLADILSVLALTMSVEGERESLKYKMLGSQGDIASWGHEFVMNLTGEITEEYWKQQSEGRFEEFGCAEFFDLVDEVVAFHMEHNAEPVAVDLLTEVDEEGLQFWANNMKSANYKRACMYLTTLARYLPADDTLVTLLIDIARSIYIEFEDYPKALQIALLTDKLEDVDEIFTSCLDLPQKKQLCYILARHGTPFELNDLMVAEDEDRYALQDIINNTKLSEAYLTLARDIDVMEPKSPENIYKAHFLYRRASSGASVDSASENLAAMFVNAFVNAGFGEDKLMTVPSEASGDDSSGDSVFKNKEYGKFSAAASLGMIHLWDVHSAQVNICKYVKSNDNHVVAGGLLGVGIANCSIKNNFDSDSFLSKYKNHEDTSIRIGSIMGLGLAYAGTKNKNILWELRPILRDSKTPLDVIAFTVISLGLVFVGSCKFSIAEEIISAVSSRSASELGEPIARFLPLGLGLLYLGKKDDADGIVDASRRFKTIIRRYSKITILSCAYAGTGNVDKVKHLLGKCTEHLGREATHQGAAVLGLAMVAMSEEVGLEMEIRSMEHLLQYGERNIRRAIPLALGLLCISNPKVNVVDMLSRLSHDIDKEVIMAAIISLGLVGAGTNNAGIAGMLRNLSSLFYREASILFCVRIAQGLLHLGKGLLTLAPHHSERFLLSPVAMAGIITLLHSCLDMQAVVVGKYHFVLYFLVLAVQPRMLFTVDENLKPLSVPVRVGLAVDVVGRPGRPRAVTGFQTLSTPVLLAAGERAELITEKYIPLSPMLEGFIVLRENPEYKDDK